MCDVNTFVRVRLFDSKWLFLPRLKGFYVMQPFIGHAPFYGAHSNLEYIFISNYVREKSFAEVLFNSKGLLLAIKKVCASAQTPTPPPSHLINFLFSSVM